MPSGNKLLTEPVLAYGVVGTRWVISIPIGQFAFRKNKTVQQLFKRSIKEYFYWQFLKAFHNDKLRNKFYFSDILFVWHFNTIDDYHEIAILESLSRFSFNIIWIIFQIKVSYVNTLKSHTTKNMPKQRHCVTKVTKMDATLLIRNI